MSYSSKWQNPSLLSKTDVFTKRIVKMVDDETYADLQAELVKDPTKGKAGIPNQRYVDNVEALMNNCPCLA